MLKVLRNKIDQIDQQITDLLADRHQIVKEVAEVKQKNNLPIEDCDREQSSIENLICGRDLNDSQKAYIKKILSAIHKASKELQ